MFNQTVTLSIAALTKDELGLNKITSSMANCYLTSFPQLTLPRYILLGSKVVIKKQVYFLGIYGEWGVWRSSDAGETVVYDSTYSGYNRGIIFNMVYLLPFLSHS